MVTLFILIRQLSRLHRTLVGVVALFIFVRELCRLNTSLVLVVSFLILVRELKWLRCALVLVVALLVSVRQGTRLDTPLGCVMVTFFIFVGDGRRFNSSDYRG